MATLSRDQERRSGFARAPSERLFSYEGKDRNGKVVRGELRALSEAVAGATLRRQGIRVSRMKDQGKARPGRISERDITYITRQMATMMQAGVPLLQSFDIIGRGHDNGAVSRLLAELRTDVETGSSLATAFGRHPEQFDPLYVSLISAGERGGILDGLLNRLATHREKMLALKGKVKKALFYPVATLAVALVVVGIIMVYVIPQFRTVFSQFGADLPAPTLVLLAVSEFVSDWWLGIGVLIAGSIAGVRHLVRRSEPTRAVLDRASLRMWVVGPLLHKAAIARWTRTLATMFGAGVPLVESLESVSGAAGSRTYQQATRRIQSAVSTGISLTQAMSDVQLFPNMVVQMVAIGEESGALDSMLAKVADLHDEEVDNMVDGLSSLIEPLIMVFLGVVIGSIIICVYLPLFKLGGAV